MIIQIMLWIACAIEISFYSSICILSCASRAARLDSNSDSLRAWSSPCFTFGETENHQSKHEIELLPLVKQSNISNMSTIALCANNLHSRTIGGVRLWERRLRSLSLRFLSFFFFFFSGEAGVGGDNGSSIGDALSVACARAGDSNVADGECLRWRFFFDFLRLSLDVLMVLVERYKSRLSRLSRLMDEY